MPDNVINLYDTRRMLNVLAQIRPAPAFLRNTFFRNPIFHDTDTIDIDIVKKGNRVIPYVRPIQEGVVMERGGFSTKSYKMPYTRIKCPSEADKYLTRSAGESVYGLLTPAQRAAQALIDDFEYLTGNLDAEEERQAAEAVFTGKVKIRNEKGVTFHEIDLQITNNQTLTGAALWSDASQTAGKMLQYLRGVRQSITKTGAPTPTDLLLATDVANTVIEKFAPTNGTSSGISGIKAERGQINLQALPDGVTYVGYFAELGCDIWSYDGVYIDLDGTEKKYAPDGMMAMLSRNARMDRNYGAIKNFHSGFISIDRFPHTWIEADGRGRFVQVESAPLFTIHHADSVAIRKVL